VKHSKLDIIQLFSNLNRKGISDGMMRDLIDTLWREMYWLFKEGHLNDPDMIALTPEELETQFPELVHKRNIIDEITNYSILLGHGHESKGDLSIIVGGTGNIANDYKEVIMGGYATEGTGSKKEWIQVDRLIVVGNGEDDEHRHNALIIYKDGYAVFNNSVVVGDYEHGDFDGEGNYVITPVEGSIRFTAESGFEGWWNGEWVPFGGGLPSTEKTFDCHIHFEEAVEFKYICPYNMKLIAVNYSPGLDPEIDAEVNDEFNQYDTITITPDSTGLLTLTFQIIEL
jgi:hypothetical protein